MGAVLMSWAVVRGEISLLWEGKRRGDWGGSGCCEMMSGCLLRVEFLCGWRAFGEGLNSHLWRTVSLRVGTVLDLSFICCFTDTAVLL